MKQSRLDQLADSIFAIVMTILVFEIRIPEYTRVVSDQVLLDSIFSVYPAILSYIISFFLLFTYWRSHHFIQSILAKNIDTHFSNLNAVFFLFVGLVPFSSHFLGKYNYSKIAIIVFGINIILIGISLFFMRQYVLQSETIENEHITKTENEHANMHILFPVIASVLAIIISFFSTKIAIILFTIAIMFNLLKSSTRYIYYVIDLFRSKQNGEEIL